MIASEGKPGTAILIAELTALAHTELQAAPEGPMYCVLVGWLKADPTKMSVAASCHNDRELAAVLAILVARIRTARAERGEKDN
jgi:hypothetical protein